MILKKWNEKSNLNGKSNEFTNNNKKKPQFNEFYLIYSFILDYKMFFF